MRRGWWALRRGGGWVVVEEEVMRSNTTSNTCGSPSHPDTARVRCPRSMCPLVVRSHRDVKWKACLAEQDDQAAD